MGVAPIANNSLPAVCTTFFAEPSVIMIIAIAHPARPAALQHASTARLHQEVTGFVKVALLQVAPSPCVISAHRKPLRHASHPIQQGLVWNFFLRAKQQRGESVNLIAGGRLRHDIAPAPALLIAMANDYVPRGPLLCGYP
uniref:Uncharacterized protein n=1 Tax=Anopheles coluzzii TaxID=1518534 RepID=A0A8W7Q2E1_ANOCL